VPTPTFNVNQELLDRVETRLNYGDSRSEWLRNAIRLRLATDELLDELTDLDDYDERVEYIESAIRNESERSAK